LVLAGGCVLSEHVDDVGVALQGGKVLDVDVLREVFAVGEARDMGSDDIKFCDIIVRGLKGRIGVIEAAKYSW
jgi:hypothetical protein